MSGEIFGTLPHGSEVSRFTIRVGWYSMNVLLREH